MGDDEWSDDDEEKDAEKLHKYNLPPSPSKNDFYDDYDMYDNSNYGSDDEKNVQIEKMSTFRMDTKKKKNSDSNNNKSNKGPPMVKKNTYVDEVEMTDDDDDDLGSELVFKSSQPSKMPKPAQRLNDARAAAVKSSIMPSKSKTLSLGKGSDSSADRSKTTMPANLLGTKGGVIRVRAPGRAKLTR